MVRIEEISARRSYENQQHYARRDETGLHIPLRGNM
jgi:hypothetical protein